MLRCQYLIGGEVELIKCSQTLFPKNFHRLGEEGEGFKIAMSGLDGGRLSIGACSLGAAQACFEIATSYVKVRKSI